MWNYEKINKWQKAQYNSNLPKWWKREEVGKDNRFVEWMVVTVLTSIFRYWLNYIVKK